MATSVSC